jgi:hypothetical protein
MVRSRHDYLNGLLDDVVVLCRVDRRSDRLIMVGILNTLSVVEGSFTFFLMSSVPCIPSSSPYTETADRSTKIKINPRNIVL